ncbi:MAG: WD40 repeat domain-containing protein [Candidatus Hodarchaeales archaeon]|jgi:hypothetical protein
MFVYEDCFYTDGEPIDYLLKLDPYLIVGTSGDTTEIRELKSPTEFITNITDKKNPFKSLACDDKHLYVGRANNYIEMWNLDRLEVETTFQSKSDSLYPITVTPNYIFIGGKDRIEVLDKKSKKFLGFLGDSSQYPQHPFGKVYINRKKLAAKISPEIIGFWDLSTLQEVFIFTAEEYISTFLLAENFLLVGTEICMEIGDPCSINVWSLPNMECIARLGEFQNTFVFDLKISRDSYSNKLYLVGATINTVDIWEWKTWKHIARIKDLVNVNHCQLVNDKLLVGDIFGRVDIWQKTK